jgi:hypothetical protein
VGGQGRVNQKEMNRPVSAFMEISLYLATTAICTVLVLVGVLHEEGCIWIATALLVGVFVRSWLTFDRGRHPCFLFLGMLLVFQGGRLLAHVLGAFDDPMRIDVAVSVPIHISTPAAELTLLVLVLSAIFVYAPCHFGYQSVVLEPRQSSWLPALYTLVALTLPFALYKNWSYLSYIRTHGGYLAVYIDNADVLKSAGSLVRLVSLISSTALTSLYVLEHRKARLRWILAVYLAVSTMDLLIGFRGKFFSQILGLWYIHKLKSGKGFKVLPLAISAISISLVAVLIAGFRGDLGAQLLSPLSFLAVQGVSLNVTESAVAFSSLFSRYGLSYLLWGFSSGVVSVPSGVPHRLWTNDLTMYLNPTAASLGFGTASTYLAELYLFGGLATVVIGSIAIGYTLHFLHKMSARLTGAILLAVVLPPIIYLPRLELFGPLAILAKATMSVIPIAAFIALYDSCRTALSIAKRPVERLGSL